ncbi:hypothetical protein G6321_00050300 [Bradyrhizobium barranii subsp. barranii]|uniref:Uncharacterized protein n=1 Tax=Bradyrhizobium barranii subsp. barranii TaxID=2823807 RepID=A0A7Z0QAP5_9BRAD|nr:hypothetical protein [Bradyrhizobium barranii]UGX93688.1 hypothetical protein G6321_00050300 [Bradyrhizobium barranii subsp. barranii]
MNFLDDLISAGGDDIGEANAPAAGGSLIVAERSPTGNFLLIEQEAFLAAGSLAYLVAFVEADEATGEPVLINAREFADAAEMVSLPDEQVALQWLNQRLGEMFAPWRPRLAEAWADALSNSEITAKPKPEDAPRIWKRPPHSTGKLGRGRK